MLKTVYWAELSVRPSVLGGILFWFLFFFYFSVLIGGFPGGSVVKNLPANALDTDLICVFPGSGRSPGERNGNPPWYSCLGSPVDRGAWWTTVHWFAKDLDTTQWLSNSNLYGNQPKVFISCSFLSEISVPVFF